MRGIKPFKLSFFTRPFQWGPKHHLGVSVVAMFAFEPKGMLLTDMEMWDFVGNELGSQPLDVGIPKSRTEYLVWGRCYQPHKTPAPTCPVKVRVGDLEKTLYVVGDRVWKDSVPTLPKPFTEMPIDYAHAFGGEGFERNPIGKGAALLKDEAGHKVRPLPNIETPGAMIDSESKRPEPAAFGPIDFAWPQRMSLAGTYDKAWLETRYPGFAADLDWQIWNVAPPDQRRETPWNGDETFAIEHMHPEKTHLTGVLPGVRGRCFITRVPTPDQIEEIELKLSTVWLFPHAERGVVIFQGAVDVVEDDGADVHAIMVAADRMNEPRTFEHYQRAFSARTGEEAAANPAIVFDDADLVPGEHVGFGPEIEEHMRVTSPEGLQLKRQRARADRAIADGRKVVEELGLNPDEHAPQPFPPEEATPKLAELPAVMKKAMEDLAKHKEEMAKTKAKALAEVKELYDELGLSFEEVAAEVESTHRGPPTFRAETIKKDIRDAADAAAASGHSLPEIEFYATDPEVVARLEDAEKNAFEMYRLSAHLQDPALRRDDPALTESIVRDAAAGASFARRDFTGIDLSGASLRGVDFEGTFLESSNLTGTDLNGANLTGAVLAHADLSNASLHDVKLGGANLGRAKLGGAQLVGANLEGATLWGTDLSGATLTGSQVTDAILFEVSFPRADCSRVDLARTVWMRTVLTEAKFLESRLTGCVFIDVDLTGVDFSGALLEEVTFVDCTLEGARFVNAVLRGVRCVGDKRSWVGVDMKGADLTGANLRGRDLTRADFSGARLDKADLSEAVLQEARFYRAVARDSLWVKADLRSAFMVSIDLLRANLQKADLRGADLRGANLYAADFALIQSDAATNVTDANQLKVRVLPQRDAVS